MCVNVVLFLDASKASGGERDPSADVCSHSASADCETGELNVKGIFLIYFGWMEKNKSSFSTVMKWYINKSTF